MNQQKSGTANSSHTKRSVQSRQGGASRAHINQAESSHNKQRNLSQPSGSTQNHKNHSVDTRENSMSAGTTPAEGGLAKGQGARGASVGVTQFNHRAHIENGNF
jgi:hypothetical protein